MITATTETKTFITTEFGRFEVPYSGPIINDDVPTIKKTKDGYIIGLLYRDSDAPDIFKDQDGNGEILSFHRHAGAEMHRRAYTAMGRVMDDGEEELCEPDPYHRVLSCYQHGCEVWSLRGQGTQCRFDTAQVAGVWVPDKCAIENIEAICARDTHRDREEVITAYALIVIETYNKVLAGEVYGLCFARYDVEWNLVSEDSCWGYIGWEDTIKVMKSQLGVLCANKK